MLTGDPIFVIASAKSANRKIGGMVQILMLDRIAEIAG